MNPQQFGFQWHGKVIFGAGRAEEIGAECRAFGSRAFLATNGDLVDLGVAERVQGLLTEADLEVTLYDHVKPDPTSDAVDEAVAICRGESCSVVVGLGGGSSLDFAKGVAVGAGHPEPIWEYVNYTGADARPVTDASLPSVAVPTTAGTGAEVSQGVVLHNTERHMKAALLSTHAFPRVAIVDPELTYTMPPKVTAMTGFDALTHGMEAFLNHQRHSPISDLVSLETVRTVTKYLPRVLENQSDQDARAHMAWAGSSIPQPHHPGP